MGIRTMQLLPELKEGGLERAVIGEAIFLQDLGHPTIVVSKGGLFESDLAAAGVEHINLPIHAKNPISAYRIGMILSREVREREVELIHGHSRVPAWIGFFAAKRTGVPFVTTASGYYEPHFLSKVMCYGDVVIAVSNGVAFHLVSKLRADEKRLRVLYPALCSGIPWGSVIEKSGARVKIGLPGDGLIIGYVGRLSPRKGPDDLIEGFTYFREKTGAGLLAIFGDIHAKSGKHYNRLMKKASALGVMDYVRFMGFIHDVHVAYAACDVVVVPTRVREGFGLTIIESIICGTPVLAVEGSGALEILGDEFNQFAFASRNPRGIASKLNDHLDDPSHFSALIPLFRDRLTQAMKPEAQYNKILAIYQELLNKKL